MTNPKQDNQEVDFNFYYTVEEARRQGAFVDEAANADVEDEEE